MAEAAPRKRLDEATRRFLSVLCDCDPRSLDKVIAGLPVRGLAGQRIRATLEDAGVLTPRPMGER